ncbi:hypothetical protein [Nocardia brasiliensis]|uniref:hypothetical protein n=1 Tax=Nocardia brasiliensis TaxID=37326 RepID=UPI003D92517A
MTRQWTIAIVLFAAIAIVAIVFLQRTTDHGGPPPAPTTTPEPTLWMDSEFG